MQGSKMTRQVKSRDKTTKILKNFDPISWSKRNHSKDIVRFMVVA